MKYIVKNILFCCLLVMFAACTNLESKNKNKIELIIIQPEHFHAALVQKYMHDDIDSSAYLFAENAASAEGYQNLIQQFNSREEQPTNWEIIAYYGNDFLDQLFRSDIGNVVVLAGDNQRKIDYVTRSVANKKDVFADKPLVIDAEGYDQLVSLFQSKDKETPLVYDIMTERFDIKNRIVKALLLDQDFSGGINQNVDQPAIQFSSTHHFIKEVSGKPLIRPAMFYNTLQQGEGLVDVTTHYIDLVYWMLSSEEPIDIAKDLQLDSSFRWSTRVSQAEFVQSTNLKDYPEFLKSNLLEDKSLPVFSNGKLGFTFKGVPVSIAVQWDVGSVGGSADRFLASFDAKNCRIEIRADKAGAMAVFVTPYEESDQFEEKLMSSLQMQSDLPGLSVVKDDDAYQIIIPQELYLSHEEHFSKVLEQFLTYRKQGNLPEWEKSFILAKYYLTTEALKQAKTISNEEN